MMLYQNKFDIIIIIIIKVVLERRILIINI